MILVTERPPDWSDSSPFDSPHVDRADSVATEVFLERGRWVVEIVVLFGDGIVRKRIDTFPTKRRAELSADLIKRAAERDILGPLND